MAWLRSEQSLLHHPKTVLLKTLLNVETATVIGRLHMLWWWCLDYALDGNLSKKEVKVIEDACQIPMKTLIRAGFVDSRPYRRIHDWWAIQGNYLKVRFKNQPENWRRIEELYANKIEPSRYGSKDQSMDGSKTMDVDRGRTDVEYGRTDVEVKKTTRETSRLGAAPPRSSALTKVEESDMPEFGHQDFLQSAWRTTTQPKEQYEWEHLERSLTQEERVQSKWREKNYHTRKWN